MVADPKKAQEALRALREAISPPPPPNPGRKPPKLRRQRRVIKEARRLNR